MPPPLPERDPKPLATEILQRVVMRDDVKPSSRVLSYAVQKFSVGVVCTFELLRPMPLDSVGSVKTQGLEIKMFDIEL